MTDWFIKQNLIIKTLKRQIYKLSIYIRVITILLLLVAIGQRSVGYYTFLRIFVFISGFYTLLLAIMLRGKHHSITNMDEMDFLIISICLIIILFNPIIPIHFKKEVWIIIDVICFWIFLISLIFVNEKEVLFEKTSRYLDQNNGQKVRKIIDRLRVLSPHSIEIGVLMDYICTNFYAYKRYYEDNYIQKKISKAEMDQNIEKLYNKYGFTSKELCEYYEVNKSSLDVRVLGKLMKLKSETR